MEEKQLKVGHDVTHSADLSHTLFASQVVHRWGSASWYRHLAVDGETTFFKFWSLYHFPCQFSRYEDFFSLFWIGGYLLYLHSFNFIPGVTVNPVIHGDFPMKNHPRFYTDEAAPAGHAT